MNDRQLREEMEALCFLQSIKALTPSDIRRLKEHLGSYRAVIYASEPTIVKILMDRDSSKTLTPRQLAHAEHVSTAADAIINKVSDLHGNYGLVLATLEKQNIHFTMPGCCDYPARLLDISSPPYSLYYKGALPDTSIPSIAIIGARNCSSYGRQMAREFAREVASNGIQIISGMALGIDSIAEQSAFDVGGRSYGILGSGPDVCYPRSSMDLYNQSITQGGIISEYYPGTQPLAQFFPARNRIISALSDALLVVEARERSGTLITVGMALEQGRDIYAIPGRITDSLSYGCNRLICDGATPAIRAHEFLQDFLTRLKVHGDYPRFFAASIPGDKEKSLVAPKSHEETVLFLTANERLIYSVLDYTPQTISEIFLALQEHGATIDLPVVMSTLTSMVIQHKISCVDGSNYYI